nr:hypothetical protein [Tanacetum cinerariifolium]
MARLAFCDYHNMIAVLEKYEHNADFHPIVDFVEASHIRYALTINPTVYVSHIRQFWSTARIETTDEGTKILFIVDGKPRTISESSIRRNLKLNDEKGISSLPDAELFENLTLMGPKSTGFNEFSSNIATTVSSALLTAADEPASPLGDDSQGEACPTVSGLEAGQDRVNIIKSSTLPHDSTPRVTSLAADEDSMQHKLNELTDLCTRLQRQQTEMASKITAQDLEIASLKARIKILEDNDGGVVEPSREDATIKGRSLETGKEASVDKSTERGSNDTEELEQMAREDQRRSEQIDKDVEIARIHAGEELQMMIDGLDRNNKVIARHLHEYKQAAAELTIGEKIELINELVKYQDHHLKILKERFILVWKQIEDFVPMASKEEGERFKRKGIRLEQDSAKKMKTSEEVSKEDLKAMMQLVPLEEVYVEALQVKHPIIDWEIHTEGEKDYWKIIRLGGNTAETLSIRQATSDKEKELWVELKRLFEPDVEDQLWTHTQALMHDPVEWRLYDSCGVHHVHSKDQEIFMLVERDYPLRKVLAIVMISNKLQVENYSQMANDLILKIHQIANRIPTASDEFPLPEYFPTASEDRFPLLSERDPPAEEVCTADEVKEPVPSTRKDSSIPWIEPSQPVLQ